MVPECQMPGIGSASKLVRQDTTVLQLYTRRCIVFAFGSGQQAQDGADAGHSKCYEQKEPAQHYRRDSCDALDALTFDEFPSFTPGTSPPFELPTRFRGILLTKVVNYPNNAVKFSDQCQSLVMAVNGAQA